MEFLWKALLILAIDIVLAFSAKGEPIFTTQLVCRFAGICPANQHVPSSNPTTKVPPTPATPQVTSTSPRRDDLEDSVLSILHFIKTQIEQNPDLKHVETHMDTVVGVPVSTLTKGGLAGYDEAGLVRLLRNLSSNLPRLTTNPPPKQDNHKKDQQETPTNKKDQQETPTNKKDQQETPTNKKDQQETPTNKKDQQETPTNKKDQQETPTNKKDQQETPTNKKDQQETPTNKKDQQETPTNKKDQQETPTNKKDQQETPTNKKDEQDIDIRREK